MESTSNIPKSEYNLVLLRGMLRVYISVTLFGLIMFLSAATMDWPQAWTLLAIFGFNYLTLFIWGLRSTPGVLFERAQAVKNITKRWDRVILVIYNISMIALLGSAGLDVGRYHWSYIPTWINITAFVFVLLSFLIPFWAIASNPFASGVVRIQSERGHKVVKASPYQYLRHPMYLKRALFRIRLAFVPRFLVGVDSRHHHRHLLHYPHHTRRPHPAARTARVFRIRPRCALSTASGHLVTCISNPLLLNR